MSRILFESFLRPVHVLCEEVRRAEVFNWSGTQSSGSKKTETVVIQANADLINFLKVSAIPKKKSKYNEQYYLRPIGNGLSPNGIFLAGQFDEKSNSKSKDDDHDGQPKCQPQMLSLENLKDISINLQDSDLNNDSKGPTITVGAGATVGEVLDYALEHGYTLENFSSVSDQTIAGWTQMSAHGTGSKISTVDDMVTEIEVVYPDLNQSVIVMNEKSHGEEFLYTRCGLGLLGIVTKLTLRLVPKYNLKEITFVASHDEVRRWTSLLLDKFEHVRYHWLPHTDSVIVTCCSKIDLQTENTSSDSEDCPSFAPIREKMLSQINNGGPLSIKNVKAVNLAEASFWQNAAKKYGKPVEIDLNSDASVSDLSNNLIIKKDAIVRIADSTQILGFQCGGSQNVLENCIPVKTEEPLKISEPTQQSNSNSDSYQYRSDLAYVEKILRFVSESKTPAPGPIEQRWTSRSRSPMSPAYSTNQNDVFSWIGIIMYRCATSNTSNNTSDKPGPGQADSKDNFKSESESDLNKKIDDRFQEYAFQHMLMTIAFSGTMHWAKLPRSFGQKRTFSVGTGFRSKNVSLARQMVVRRFDKSILSKFEEIRLKCDPDQLLGPVMWQESKMI